MTELQKQVLYDWLKGQFITIQKSQEINKELGTWERNIKKINEDKIEDVCKMIANEIDKFVEDKKREGIEPTTQQIMNKMKEVLIRL